MIECEFKCIKEHGSAAYAKIFVVSLNKAIYVCFQCLESFSDSEIEILETGVN